MRPGSPAVLWLLIALVPLGCRASSAEPRRDAEPRGPAAAAAADTTAAAVPAAVAETAAAAATAAAAEPATAAAPPTIRISAVGDCTIGSEARHRLAPGSFHDELKARDNDYKYPFSGVLDVLSRDDLTIANLETTLSTKKAVSRGRYVFRGEPEFARILEEGSVEVVSVANNHSHDLGFAGFRETLQSLEARKIGAFGMGEVDRRTIKGIEVVNLGYTGGDPGAVIDGMVRDVKAHKRDDNLVITSFHWGGEGVTEPNDDQIRLGHAAIDAGADLVLGHHPHVIQPIEDYQGKQIVYSLGNFVFGGHSNPEDKDAIIYQAAFRRDGGRVVPAGSEAVPVRISSVTERNDYRPVLLEGAERERVLGRLQAYREAFARRTTGPKPAR